MNKKVSFGIMVFLIVALCSCVEASACKCSCSCNCNCCASASTASTSSTAERILDACKEVTNTFLNRQGAYYSTDADLVWGDIERSYQCLGICSTTYVSLVLYVSKIFTEEQLNAYNYNWSGEGGLSSLLKGAGWIKVEPAEIQPGDIAINPGKHAMIYAGNSTFYDQETCTGIKTKDPIERSDYSEYTIYSAPER